MTTATRDSVGTYLVSSLLARVPAMMLWNLNTGPCTDIWCHHKIGSGSRASLKVQHKWGVVGKGLCRDSAPSQLDPIYAAK